jgi:hypothetical protein
VCCFSRFSLFLDFFMDNHRYESDLYYYNACDNRDLLKENAFEQSSKYSRSEVRFEEIEIHQEELIIDFH